MALFIKREEQRSQLQDKVAASLKEKLGSSEVKLEDTDPAILEDAHQTRPAGMIIMVLLFLVVIGAVALVISMR